MTKNKRKNKSKIMALSFYLIALSLLTACGESAPEPILPELELAEEYVDVTEGSGKVRISEFMAKNRTTLRDEDGNFSDWIELENCSGEKVSLLGWTISDSKDRSGWVFPAVELGSGERLIVYADGKDRTDVLHTDFSLSEGENIYLRNQYGYEISFAPALSNEADLSVCINGEGEYEVSLYPSPAYPNELQYYEQWQRSQLLPGPLAINRVAVSNQTYELHGADWVEIKNISTAPVDLSAYYLSDDEDNYKRWRFPEIVLGARSRMIVCCDEELTDSSLVIADFSLNSENEQLYLSSEQGQLIDYVSLKNIPYDCSYGRVDGKEGWFYLYGSGPSERSEKSFSRVSEMPESMYADGVFNNVNDVQVELKAKGKIYYTIDSSLPTEKSKLYSGPFSVNQTTVIRAICVEDGAMPSRPLTLSYIINEDHSLPVLSLVSNDKEDFEVMYGTANKEWELIGNLALYEQDGGFNIPCGIKMHGGTSLAMSKKNMSVRFRALYGQEELNYDVYGGGVKKFTNFVLRSGQDYLHAIVRNELMQNLALASSDKLVTQRSKYCVLYVDGKYFGIYNLMEKGNEQHYANLAGVSKDSVSIEEPNFSLEGDFYKEVVSFCQQNDMAKPENFQHFCSVMDVDSLIDWMVLQGFCANGDLNLGNVRYCRSTENDGKWRLIFYDLDAAFFSTYRNFSNVLEQSILAQRKYGQIVAPLLENEEFIDRFLKRAADLLSTTLTNENVVAEIERLSAIIDPEVERDYAQYGMSYYEWRRNVEELKNYFYKWNWPKHNVDALSELLNLSDEQREYYFEEVLK